MGVCVCSSSIIAAWLSVGQVLTEAEHRLKHKVHLEVALQKAFRFIAINPARDGSWKKRTPGYEESWWRRDDG
jgi:hypothetical protein